MVLGAVVQVITSSTVRTAPLASLYFLLTASAAVTAPPVTASSTVASGNSPSACVTVLPPVTTWPVAAQKIANYLSKCILGLPNSVSCTRLYSCSNHVCCPVVLYPCPLFQVTNLKQSSHLHVCNVFLCEGCMHEDKAVLTACPMSAAPLVRLPQGLFMPPPESEGKLILDGSRSGTFTGPMILPRSGPFTGPMILSRSGPFTGPMILSRSEIPFTGFRSFAPVGRCRLRLWAVKFLQQ